MSARDEILGRVRAALADVPVGEPREAASPSGYDVASGLATEDLVDRFAERSAEYRATVRRTGADPDGVAGAVAEALAAHEARRIVVPFGVAGDWRPDGIDVTEDSPRLPPAELEVFDGVLTGCALAIADTGTIVLDAGADQGRRALTLVPDLHVCVVEAGRIVGTVPEAIRALEHGARGNPRPLTLISGPSATSDIELNRVEGVHGPRRLEIVVAG